MMNLKMKKAKDKVRYTAQDRRNMERKLGPQIQKAIQLYLNSMDAYQDLDGWERRDVLQDVEMLVKSVIAKMSEDEIY